MSYTSGQTVPTSGIYKCGCGREKTCVKGEPFPPCECGNPRYTLVRATRT